MCVQSEQVVKERQMAGGERERKNVKCVWITLRLCILTSRMVMATTLSQIKIKIIAIIIIYYSHNMPQGAKSWKHVQFRVAILLLDWRKKNGKSFGIERLQREIACDETVLWSFMPGYCHFAGILIRYSKIEYVHFRRKIMWYALNLIGMTNFHWNLWKKIVVY